jgi:hypothetical protein
MHLVYYVSWESVQLCFAFALRKEIKIEGLQSEKRMIQATDRKLMDVQRQNQIEQEINKLENN